MNWWQPDNTLNPTETCRKTRIIKYERLHNERNRNQTENNF